MAEYPFETNAKKILGNGAKLPKPRTDPIAALQAANKVVEDFRKSIHGLGDQLLKLENAIDAYKNTLDQYSDIVDAADFDLDEKKPDDKKKIDAAKNIMQKGIAEKVKDADEYFNELKKLDKIITNLRRLDKVDV
ncbi:MAG TPA: hypothetical protein VFE51_31510 [Verrucomicrobiae bacterium]|nr:hypothetical protein [Verrucomicrobiae bacterium]